VEATRSPSRPRAGRALRRVLHQQPPRPGRLCVSRPRCRRARKRAKGD
jgi:hypothetical protein